MTIITDVIGLPAKDGMVERRSLRYALGYDICTQRMMLCRVVAALTLLLTWSAVISAEPPRALSGVRERTSSSHFALRRTPSLVSVDTADQPTGDPQVGADEPPTDGSDRLSIEHPDDESLDATDASSDSQELTSEPLTATPPSDELEYPHAGWWDAMVQRPLREQVDSVPISLDSILSATLAHSSYVRVVQDLPLIRETSIVEADAQFDWTSFLESNWIDTSEPVGSRLVTGGPPRFRDHHATAGAGVRRKNPTGGQFEIAQRIGAQQTNSVFFVPGQQGTSRITVNYTHPLLRNAGRAYNTSLTLLAQIDTASARDEFSEKLQAHIVDVTRAYWEVYLQRGVLLQKRRLLASAEKILVELDRRSQIDALLSQIVRARAAVASRKAELVRAETEVKNAESRLRSLVNDPELGNSQRVELIPRDAPHQMPCALDLNASLELALQHRPELARAVKQIKSAGVRLNVSKNELLPALNVVLETYVAGLRGNNDIGAAWLDQYRQGEPSYSVGLQYEMPLWNRAAQARYQRRRLELRQLQSQMQTTLQTLQLEVEVAVREVTTTYQEMAARHRAMEAERTKVNYIYDRWQLLPSTDRSAALLLEDLLDAQDRLNSAEYGFLQSQLNYSLSQASYLKSVGVLLQSEQISVERYCECHIPNLRLESRPSLQTEKSERSVPSESAQIQEEQETGYWSAEASDVK